MSACLLCEMPFDYFPDEGEGICTFCMESWRAAEKVVAELKKKRNRVEEWVAEDELELIVELEEVA